MEWFARGFCKDFRLGCNRKIKIVNYITPAKGNGLMNKLLSEAI